MTNGGNLGGADHFLGDLILGDFGEGARVNEFAAAQNSDVVANFLDFGEFMRDENDRGALFTKSGHRGK
jgi:hypothetical protein